jgi:hypothetical protein
MLLSDLAILYVVVHLRSANLRLYPVPDRGAPIYVERQYTGNFLMRPAQNSIACDLCSSRCVIGIHQGDQNCDVDRKISHGHCLARRGESPVQLTCAYANLALAPCGITLPHTVVGPERGELDADSTALGGWRRYRMRKVKAKFRCGSMGIYAYWLAIT